MATQKTIGDKIWNWLFSKPAVAQFWASRISKQNIPASQGENLIPFTRLKKPLSQCRVALITTGGIHLPQQPPFDMENPEGDASYREIPGNVDSQALIITHKYYNHSDADKDVNIIFPIDRFRELVDAGIIGAIAPRHFSFMGHIEGKQLPILINRSAPEVARMLKKDDVDFAFLTPA